MEIDLFLSFNDPQQVRYLCYRPAHRRSVGPLDNLIQLPQAQATHDFFLLARKSNRTPVILNLDSRRRGFRFLFLRNHRILRLDLFRWRTCPPHLRAAQVPLLNESKFRVSYSSSTCFPRNRATSNGSFILSKPSKVARTTLCGFVDPRTLVRTS